MKVETKAIIQEVPVYIADDGTEFNTEAECRDYEVKNEISQRLIWNILSYIEANYPEENEQYNALVSLLDGTIGLEDRELKKVYM